MPPDNKIKITVEDTKNPKVDADLERQKRATALPPAMPQVVLPSAKLYPPAKVYGSVSQAQGPARANMPRMLHSTPVYSCLAGAIGAVVGWMVTELVFWEDNANPLASRSLGYCVRFTMLWNALNGAAVGLSLGAVEGIVCRSRDQALRGAGLGLLIGFIGCAFGGIVAQLLYSGMLSGGDRPSLPLVMVARTIGWGVAGCFYGLGPGAAMMSGKKLLNGFLGGLGGGLVGGFLFDPIGMAFGSIQDGLVSRFVGLVVIGGAAGLLIGLVEQMLKDAWLVVEKGFLVGKQFVIYKNPTLVGSSPKCHIYLFKDPAVEPQHAAIHTVGNQYEIEDLRSRQGTFVNNVPVSRARLRNGDQIRIGHTLFRYSERKRGGR